MLAPMIDQAVAGDLVEPGAEARPALRLALAADQAEPGFLVDLVGQFGLSGQAAEKTVETLPMALVEHLEGRAVALAVTRQQRFVAAGGRRGAGGGMHAAGRLLSCVKGDREQAHRPHPSRHASASPRNARAVARSAAGAAIGRHFPASDSSAKCRSGWKPGKTSRRPRRAAEIPAETKLSVDSG